MKSTSELVTGFGGEDKSKIEQHLKRLLPFFKLDQVAIVGGLAIRYQLAKRGIDYPVRGFNDLDLVINDMSAVDSRIGSEFWVYHYHPPKNSEFFLVLADSRTGIKDDVFKQRYEERFDKVEFADLELRVASVEDQLVKSTFDISRIKESDRVDPKQFQDVALLMGIADMGLANKIWQSRGFNLYPSSMEEAVERAVKISQEHSEWIKEHPFKRAEPYVCERCQSTDGFLVQPMDKIYKMLGFVE